MPTAGDKLHNKPYRRGLARTNPPNYESSLGGLRARLESLLSGQTWQKSEDGSDPGAWSIGWFRWGKWEYPFATISCAVTQETLRGGLVTTGPLQSTSTTTALMTLCTSLKILLGPVSQLPALVTTCSRRSGVSRRRKLVVVGAAPGPIVDHDLSRSISLDYVAPSDRAYLSAFGAMLVYSYLGHEHKSSAAASALRL